ncbi:hypothetical protein D6C80_07842 [Aureobasidium pullulans]|nr:hypothetical protein D6C80_07842 [Aureobasidium pullulans]
MSSESSEPETNPWGWVIFRTSYTSDSETLWPQAISLLNAWLDDQTRISLRKCGEEEEHEETMAQLQNVLMDDPSLDKASFDQLRSRFAAWLETQDTEDEDGGKNLPLQRFKNFIVVDDLVLQSTKDAPRPDNKQAKAKDKLAPYVKVVTAQHQDGTRLPLRSARSGQNAGQGKLFPGYMKVSILDLRFFWEESFTYDLLDLCPNNFTDEPDWSKRYSLS